MFNPHPVPPPVNPANLPAAGNNFGRPRSDLDNIMADTGDSNV